MPPRISRSGTRILNRKRRMPITGVGFLSRCMLNSLPGPETTDPAASAQLARFRWFVAVSLMAIAAVLLLPDWISAPLEAVSLLAGTGIVVVRCWKLKGPVRKPSLTMSVAALVVLAGGVVRSIDSGGAAEYAFPSLADVFAAGGVMLFIAAIAIVVRRRNRRPGLDPFLDAIVGAFAFALLNWSLILPYLQDQSVPGSERAITFGFTLLSFVLVMMAFLALVAGSQPSTSNRFLAAALLASFGLDVVANQVVIGQLDQALMGPATMLVLFLGGAGLMHPTLLNLVDPPHGAGARRRLTRRRIAVLTFALITPPAVLVWQVVVGGTGIRLLLPAVGAITLVPLVLVRLARLVRQNEVLASQEATLRLVGERLVDAQSERDVSLSVQSGLEQLVGDPLVMGACVLEPFDSAAVGWMPELVPAVRAVAAELEGDPEPVTGEFHKLESVGVPGMWHAGLVVVQRELRAIVLAATSEDISELQRNSLGSLCRQAAIALRAVERTEREVRERSEQRFGSLIENSSDIVAVLDEGDHVAFLSPVSQRLLGHASGQDHLHQLDSLVGPQDVGAMRSLIDEARFSGRSKGEVRLLHAEGTQHWFEVIASDQLSDPNIGGLLF
ncbi:MAG: PAS domain S-box protein, partial [Microthrixaceae bacterium]